MTTDTTNSFLRADDIAACRQIVVDRGPTYETAMRWFPRFLAERVMVLYAFVRIPDDIVDETPDPVQAAHDLAQWQADWAAAQANPEQATHPVLRASAQLFQACDMPDAHWQAFFKAMQWDLTKDQYADMGELKEYMYGSACVVGLMMLQLMPNTEPYSETTQRQAMDLGYAMQMTNLLRDVAEDWQQRRRVYIPQDLLAHHGVTLQDFDQQRLSPKWTALMHDLTAQTRAWYDASAPGIAQLPKALRPAVRVASVLYAHCLVLLERSGFRVWTTQYSMPKRTKLRLALWALLRRRP